MQKKMKQWLLPLLLCLSLLLPWGCESDEKEVEICTISLKCPVSPFSGKAGDIVGKWKLVMATEARVSTPQLMDYSCDNIIYEFRKDGKLVITSNVAGQFEGEHEYWYLPPPYDCLISNTASIDGIPFNFRVSESILSMGAYFFVETSMPENPYLRYNYTLVRVGK